MKAVTLIHSFLLGGLLLSSGAQAAPIVYNFQYIDSVGTISGTLTGELQLDNNTVRVLSINSLFANAAPRTVVSFDSVSNRQLANNAPAIVSLTGTPMDLLVCITGGCTDGFFIINLPGQNPPAFPNGVHGAGPNSVLTEAYIARNWSLTANQGDVPEPATWGMAMSAASLLWLAARRRQRN